MIMAVLLEKREAGFVRKGAFYNGFAGSPESRIGGGGYTSFHSLRDIPVRRLNDARNAA
jgi:hypothetical protein